MQATLPQRNRNQKLPRKLLRRLTRKRKRILPKNRGDPISSTSLTQAKVPKQSKDTEQLWSPALRRPRQDWKDDRDVIEQFEEIVESNPKKYSQECKEVVFFLEIVNELRSKGFKNSKDTVALAKWIRQEYRKLEGREEESSSLKNAFVEIPMDLEKTLDKIRKTVGLEDKRVYPFSGVFRKQELLDFAKQRAKILHGTDDLSVYIENLVRKEQSGLEAPAGALFDLLETCEQIVRRKGFEVSKSFEVNACDMWVEELEVAIEPRTEFKSVEEGNLFRLLTLSSHHYDAKHLIVVLSNDIEEQSFQSCRSLQHIIEGLQVVRLKDFEGCLDEIIDPSEDEEG